MMRKRLRRMQVYICLLAVMICTIGALRASDSDKRLMIFSSQTKGDIEQKIKSVKWAGATLSKAYEDVDKYVEIHKTDSMWIVSRMMMYWKNHYTTPYINGSYYSRAEGSAPVPTVRFTGGRNWATEYGTPSIEETIPYMDYRDDQVYLKNGSKPGSPWEWVDVSKTAHQVENMNSRIVSKAMNAAFIYWMTGDEAYARFAYDIFKTYIEGMYYREVPVAEEDARNAHLVGYTSFEVIHERVLNYLPLCYDFLYDYVKAQDEDNIRKVGVVFQKFADQIIENGVSTNNWNVFQARFVTYLALSLDNDSAYENGKGKQYYIDFILNQNVPRQKALRDVCDIYDANTGFWNESPGYSMSTTKDLVEILLLLDGVESDDIFKDFGVVEKSAMSTFEYLFPNMRTTAFGDNGYSTLDYVMYESLLAMYYRKHGKQDEERLLISTLNKLVDAGLYDRDRETSLYKLFNYVDNIDPAVTSDQCLYSNFLYAPNVNLTIQRNGLDWVDGLMCVNAGTGFNHCNNNGINMELYGKGYPLGLDKARGSSYWESDHRDYYNATISHNTVLVDGVSSNGSPKQMAPGEESWVHKLISNFPESNQKDANNPYALSYVDNQYFESGTKSMQRRVNGIVRLSPTSGYYVDIFRSHRVQGGDITHEYIYHNIGQELNLFDAKGAKLPMSQSSDLTSEGGKAKGYDYLTDKTEVEYDGDFKGTFELNLGAQEGVNMDVWMKGYKDRKLFSVMSPRALKGLGSNLPQEVDKGEIPAMIVRQSGEAWERPFVAIYEPYGSSEGAAIESVEYIDSKSSDFVGIEVTSKGGAKDYILNCSALPSKVLTLKGIGAKFQASYGVVSYRDGELSSIFMGEGTLLSYGDYVISSDSPATALIEFVDGGVRVKSSAPVVLQMPKSSSAKLSYTDCNGAAQSLNGVKSGSGMSFSLPELNSVVLK